VKTNATGYQVWNKTYGGSSSDEAYSVVQTSDGGYVVTGYTASFGAGASDFWLVKSVNGSGDVAPPSTIVDLTPVSSTNNSVTLTWTAPSDYPGLGDVAGYVVKYSTSGAIYANGWDNAKTFDQSWTPLPAGSKESHVVTGLDVDTVYWFAIVSYDYIPNYSGISNSPSGSTSDPDPPAAITDLAVRSETDTSVTLTWSAPGDSGNRGNATAYSVKYSAMGPITDANWDSATTYTQSWTPRLATYSEEHIISNLTSSTRYWFAVRAFDEVLNYGGCSNSPETTTLLAAWLVGSITYSAVVGVIIIVVVAGVLLVKRRKSKSHELLRKVSGEQRKALKITGKCMVCNLDVDSDDAVLRCPHCGNMAHKIHMLEWLHVKDYCPVCRRHLEERDLKDRPVR
jgi:hypothetical protein